MMVVSLGERDEAENRGNKCESHFPHTLGLSENEMSWLLALSLTPNQPSTVSVRHS